MSYLIYLLGQFFLSACLYIHCSCVEAEVYEILLVASYTLPIFLISDFKEFQEEHTRFDNSW